MRSKAYATIGKLIRHHRGVHEMTQMDLASALGYDSPQFVSLFERGFSKVPVETLGRLVTLLGLPEDKILKLLTEEYVDDLKRNLKSGKRQVGSSLGVNKIAS